MRTSQDITAARGLSDLQRRVLVCARRAMLAKGQAVPEPKTDEFTIFLPAPEWLQDVLVSRLNEVLDRTKRLFLGGDMDACGLTRWGQFFNELLYINDGIRDAGREHGVEFVDWGLTNLYRLVDSKALLLLRKRGGFALVNHVIPTFENGYMIFGLTVKGISQGDVPGLHDALEHDGGWIEAEGHPVNCTIPELLRDIYGFPVRAGGHVDGLAFSQADIGKERYNRAQAALRRACLRLGYRGLISMRRPRRSEPDGHSTSFGIRTGLALTPEGVEIADALLAALSQFENGNLDPLAEDVERGVERLDVATLQRIA